MSKLTSFLAMSIVVILVGACAPGTGTIPAAAPANTPAPTATATATAAPPTEAPTAAPPTPAPTHTPTAVPTEVPTAGPTEKPTVAPTETAVPTATAERAKDVPPTAKPPEATPTKEAVSLVERNLADWLSGKTKIRQDQLQYSDASERYFPLGTIRPIEINKERYVSYQGILLGAQEVDGQLVLMMGFEDKAGARYALPFNAGPLQDGLLVQVVQMSSWTTGGSEKSVNQRVPVSDLAKKLPRLVGKPVEFSSFVSLAGLSKDQLDKIIEPVKQQLLPTIPVGMDAYLFILAATAGQTPEPAERIAPLLDAVPKTVSTESLPSVGGLWQAGDWLTAP